MQNLAAAVPLEKPEAGLVALDSALQEQERIITMSYTLASEASLKSKLVAGWWPVARQWEGSKLHTSLRGRRRGKNKKQRLVIAVT